jgi:hypothetical protein
MPIAIPRIDDRRYKDLLEEAVARIPIHNPEWTNFNRSDPGITLLELFAFLTENLLYRSNQIPERNRMKFLQLLGVPLRPAASAEGLVAFANAKGPLEALTLNAGLEVRAGEVPFRTEQGLDVLPVDARFFVKRERTDPDPDELRYYAQLYASFVGDPPIARPKLYQVVPWTPGAEPIDLGQTVDGSLWMAVLARDADKPFDDDKKALIRRKLEGKTVSLGIVPALTDAQVHRTPGGPPLPSGGTALSFAIPSMAAGTVLPPLRKDRIPHYAALDGRGGTDLLRQPGIVQVTLPAAASLRLWTNLDPLEAGVGDFPPTLEDTDANDRLVTWIRIRAAGSSPARLLWAGVNAVPVTQRLHVAGEVVRPGTGEPDQVATLSQRPAMPGTVSLTVTSPEGTRTAWSPIADLFDAGPEVPVHDSSPPGSAPPRTRPSTVFLLDAEAGQLRFGDGARGARPLGEMRVDYDVSMGARGNLGPDAITRAASLPAGITVTNPLRTWGGADAETVREGERQITRFLQHRERLVTAEDFATIARRAPGVDVGRIEVLPAYSPALGASEPGDAPGAVTLMVLPRFDPDHPDAPEPDRLFLEALCRHLDPRRLVTTEIFLCPAEYKDVWISAGIDVVAGYDFPVVREAARGTLMRMLSPLPADPGAAIGEQAALATPQQAARDRGWPLRKPLDRLELMAEVSRTPGVRLVKELFVAEGTLPPTESIPFTGLQLPRVRGISLTLGDARSLDDLRGIGVATTTTTDPAFVPVPVLPEEC